MDGRKRGRVRRERERKTFNLLVHCLDACNDQMWIRQKLRDWNSVGVCDLSGRDPSYSFCIRDLGIWGIKQPWRFWSEFPIDTGALKDWCIGLLVKHFRTFRTCVIKIRAIYFPILLEVAESKIKLPVIFCCCSKTPLLGSTACRYLLSTALTWSPPALGVVSV